MLLLSLSHFIHCIMQHKKIVLAFPFFYSTRANTLEIYTFLFCHSQPLLFSYVTGAEEEAKFPIPSAPRSLKQLQTPYSQQARQTKLSQPSSDSHISGEDDSLLHDEGELDESDLPPGLFTPSSGDTPTETDARVAEQNDSSLSEEVDMEDCP